MTKERTTISLDSDLMADLRQRSLTKYGKMKYMSKMIEEMLYASIRSESDERV